MANLIDYGDQSQAQVSPGWSLLGAMLGDAGADPTQSPAYLRGAQQGATIANVMAEGRDRQAKYLGREALAKQLDDEGDPDSAGAVRAGVDPQQVLAAKKIKAALDLQTEAHGILEGMGLSGDSKINRLTNLATFKPTETQAVQDNTLVSRFDTRAPVSAAPPVSAPGSSVQFNFAPNTPDSVKQAAYASAIASGDAVPAPTIAGAMGAQPTQIGQSIIADHMAAAGEHRAQGRTADARTAVLQPGNPLFDARVAKAGRAAGRNGMTPEEFAQRQAVQARYAIAKTKIANGADPDTEMAAAQRDVDAIVAPPSPAASGSTLDALGGLVSAFLGHPVAPGTAPAPSSAPSSGVPPPAAFKGLAPGASRKFSNGQVWTLDASGNPVRVQ